MKKKALLLAGAGPAEEPPAECTIGVPGQWGFGVGCSDVPPKSIGLTPLPGYSNPRSINYGNYRHTNGSVMVFIPAFCYRRGYETAPSYARDGANALEIRNALDFPGFNHGNAFTSADMGDGWILHRAFVDDGKMMRGFFIDKYKCSANADNTAAVSVKNGSPLVLQSNASYPSTSWLPDGAGVASDAITLSQARGRHYSVCTAFQRSALAMLALAHGQAATSADACAWHDSEYVSNFPKGYTQKRDDNTLTDINDDSIDFELAFNQSGSRYALTGSGIPFAKTTHNGQPSGVCDLSGNGWEACIGFHNTGVLAPLLPTVNVSGVTAENVADPLLYDTSGGLTGQSATKLWGSGTVAAFYPDSSGPGWAACGVYAAGGSSSSGTNLFGKDKAQTPSSAYLPLFGGAIAGGTQAGVWARYHAKVGWAGSYAGTTFRASAYPPTGLEPPE